MVEDITDYVGFPQPKRIKIQNIVVKRNGKVIDYWDVAETEGYERTPA